MPWRSEEHTSELQSRRDLVCRLLLEKKKKKHVIVVGVPNHTKRHKIDYSRPIAGSRALGGPCEVRRDRVRIGTVDRDARDAVADRLVGEDANGRLLPHSR